MRCIKDITGQRFGRLVAVRPTKERYHSRVVWKCKCDCGSVKAIDGAQLRSGKLKSCGCSRHPEKQIRIPKRKTFTYDEVEQALVDNQGFVTRAAKSLGIAYRTFINHCKRLGIDPHGYYRM